LIIWCWLAAAVVATATKQMKAQAAVVVVE
jgi:hypothetical protein